MKNLHLGTSKTFKHPALIFTDKRGITQIERISKRLWQKLANAGIPIEG